MSVATAAVASLHKSCPNCASRSWHAAFSCRECGWDFLTKSMPTVAVPEIAPPRMAAANGKTVVIAPALGRYSQKPLRPSWLKYEGKADDEDELRDWIDCVRRGWSDDFGTWLSAGAVVSLARQSDNKTLREAIDLIQRLA